MKPTKDRLKGILKILLITIAIFFIGGIGGVYFDQKVLPFVRTNRYLSKIKFLKHTAENVTIIKTIEQVTIKDSESVSEISSQPSNATVNILSLPSQKNQTTKLVKKTDKQGTGVIITSDGIIVTHRSTILENEAEYKIFLYDGSYYEGSLLGIDSFNDLAYLKVNAPNLTAISFGESSTVQPGKKLVAIGNVFGEYQNRFAMGLLSNINKTFNLAALSVASTEKYEGVFEMDFNNQEKYLGGPIINYNGELLGIVGKVTIDGKEQYFQIPAGEIKKSIAYVIDGKFENRPFVGAYYVSISKEYALTHSIRRDRGALIYSPSGKQGLAIIAGSPAERAGLQVNDIVIMVNNKAVNLDNPFSNLINQYKKGDMVELTVDRAGSELKLSLSL